ncbi:hypothetical protein B0H12DRAFT_1075821 [Mycena haematopus]|nr:hypothetical protein B0H12DRAFT_1075821 [Mycena haematopus]
MLRGANVLLGVTAGFGDAMKVLEFPAAEGVRMTECALERRNVGGTARKAWAISAVRLPQQTAPVVVRLGLVASSQRTERRSGAGQSSPAAATCTTCVCWDTLNKGFMGPVTTHREHPIIVVVGAKMPQVGCRSLKGVGGGGGSKDCQIRSSRNGWYHGNVDDADFVEWGGCSEEVGDDGRIVVFPGDILPVSEGVEVECGLLFELAIVIRAIFILQDRVNSEGSFEFKGSSLPSSHWYEPDSHSGFPGHFFSWKNRCSLRPALQYYYIDFGLSNHFPDGKESAQTAGTLRTFPMIPELSNTVYPAFDDFRIVAASLTVDDPHARATLEDALNLKAVEFRVRPDVTVVALEANLGEGYNEKEEGDTNCFGWRVERLDAAIHTFQDSYIIYLQARPRTMYSVLRGTFVEDRDNEALREIELDFT